MTTKESRHHGSENVSERATWPLGCQVMPWLQANETARGPQAWAALPDIVRVIAAIGFAGYETILPNLPLDQPQPLLDGMLAAGVWLTAAHSGGPWWDASAQARIPEIVAQTHALATLGCDRLVVSLFPRPNGGPTPVHVASAVRLLGALGRACREEAGECVVDCAGDKPHHKREREPRSTAALAWKAA